MLGQKLIQQFSQMRSLRLAMVFLVVIGSVANSAALASGSVCPFCSAIALTFTEQLNSNEIAVVAKLVELPPPPVEDEDGFLEFPKGKFEIVGVLKGEKIVNVGMTFKTQLVGTYDQGTKFLVMGVNPPRVSWTTPMRASDRVFEYLKDIQKLPESGPERLVFFQDYFEDEEAVLAFDAYDEYAKAPYEDLIAMKDQMDHDRLMEFIQNPETTVNRRRLYLTLLGVCGTKQDAEILEGYLKSGDNKQRRGLDALIACYLILKGEEGVALIEQEFLKSPDVNYVDVVATVMALRFHATETNVIPKKRIVAAIRSLLDRPKLADMIIPDLARWEDWSVMERLVQMFKESDETSNWIRVPVITYLRACPDPKAAEYIKELALIDPQAVQRADFYIGFGDEDEDEDEEDGNKEVKPSESSLNETPGAPAVKKESPPSSESKGGTPASEPRNSEKKSGEKDDKPSLQKELANLPIELPMTETRVSVAQGDPAPDVSDDSMERGGVVVPTDNSSTYVSTAARLPSEEMPESATQPIGTVPAESKSRDDIEQVASSVMDASIGEEKGQANLTWQIIFVPFLGSLLILATMWSVANGWFERLIY